MSYVSHDGLAYFKHKLDQKFISNITSEDGALKIVLGDGTVLKSIQDTTVTQKKSTANELYPLLLCYDAMADQDQLSKETWFGQHILANPYYGYLASRGMYVKHPTFNRRNGVSQKVEWAYDFTDAVSGLGNPMSQVYAYVDPASEGGEHCIELRLYGNPNVSPTVPSVNDSTNTFSIGVGVTGGNVQFGYCPSTPLYLDDGSTLRTEATGHGNDIITRDWLNLNGSLTGLVHTTMNETIDGAKTFKKTVTINSGDNNNKAGLYVQGNSDIYGNEHVHGTETVDGKLTANGTAEIKGGSGNNPSLLVTGNETVTGKLTGTGTAEFSGGSGNTPTLTVNGNESVSGNSSVGGNSSITGNETVGGNISTTNGNISTTNGTVSGKTGSIGSGGLTVAGNETVSGKITGNGGAEISGGSGLKVNGDETVTGDITTNGTITKVVNNTPVEYVTYVTNQPTTREIISQNLLALGKGLAKDSNGKIYVDFSQIDDSTKAAILDGLNMQIPLKTNIDLIVNPSASNNTDSYNLDFNTRVATPFTTIQKAVTWASSKLALGTKNVYIKIANGIYHESVSLPEVNTSSGHIELLPLTDGGSVSITPPINSNGCYPSCVYAASGACKWTLRHISFDLRFGINTSSSAHTASCVLSGADGAVIDLIGCNFFLAPELVNGSRRTEITGGPQACSLINADSGTINLYPDDSGSAVTFYLPETNTAGVSITVLNAARNGRLAFRRRAAASNGKYVCKGTCNIFMHAWQGGNTALIGSNGAQTHFVVADGETVTGKKYVVETGAYVLAPSGGFPGETEGSTVDTTKACWVSGV